MATPPLNTKIVLTFPGGEVLQVDGPPEFVEKLLNGDTAATALHALRTPPPPTPVLGKIVLEQGLDHGWEWFSLHAGHRMQSVNFFLVAVAFISAAYSTAFRFSEPTVAFGVALAGVLLTVCFILFERRIRQLVHAGEAALTPIEKRLASETGITELNLLDAVAKPSLWIASYSRVINGLHFVTTIAFLAGAIYAYKVLSRGSPASGVAQPAAPPALPWSAADTKRLAILAVVTVGFYFGARLLEVAGGPLPSGTTALRIRVLAGAALVAAAVVALLLVAWDCC